MAGHSVSPKPDPWAPPSANTAQAVGTAAGAVGVTLMATDPDPGAVTQSIAWLPDPAQIFASVANILGLEFHRSDAFSWGFVLVVLCVALNLISLYLRYRYAEYARPRWAEQIPKLESDAAQWHRLQEATPPARSQGSGGGAA